MSATGEMTDVFDAVKNKQQSTTEEVEAVMLHLRARQMVTQPRKYIVISTIIGLLTRFIFAMFGFLAAPYFQTKRFLIATLISFILYFAYQLISEQALTISIATYVVVFYATDIRSTISALRSFIFDLFDLLSFASLTKLFSKIIIASERKGCKLLLAQESAKFSGGPIAYHYFESRHAASKERTLLNLEEQYGQWFVELSDEDALKQKCQEYWNEVSGAKL